MKLKRLIGAVVFTIVLAGCILLTFRTLSWKDTGEDYVSSMEQLKNTPKNSIDVVFLGSSHVYCGVLPEVLWDEYGIASFDMAVSGADRYSSYYQLKYLLKKQNPKVVMVDIYGLITGKMEVEGNIYRNLMSMGMSKESADLIKKDADKEQFFDYFFKWPVVHSRYRELKKGDFVKNPVNSYMKGEELYWKSTPMYKEEGIDEVTACSELDEETVNWLKDMQELSAKENFRLIVMAIPMHFSEEDKMTSNAISAYCSENGISFLDFDAYASGIGLAFDEDYLDEHHLNSFGAAKLSSFIGKYMSVNMELADHRGEKKYTQWDEDLAWYQNEKLYHSLENTDDMREFLQLLSNLKDATEVMILDSECEYDYSNYEEFFSSVGIEEWDVSEGGTFIIKNNEAVRVSDDLYFEVDKTPFHIYYDEESDAVIADTYNNIFIGRKEFCNLLVIDENTGIARAAKGFYLNTTE